MLVILAQGRTALCEHAPGLDELHHIGHARQGLEVGHHEWLEALGVGAHAGGVGVHHVQVGAHVGANELRRGWVS